MYAHFYKIRRISVLCQFLVLTMALVAGILVLGVNYVHEANKAWFDELDRITQFVAGQVEEQDISLGKKTRGVNAALGSLEGDISEEEYLALTQKMGDIASPDQGITDQIHEAYKYRFFVIDSSGNFIVPRKDDDLSIAEDWARYQEKLIYEMRKKRQGWISYPEEANQKKKVIRFILAPKTDWIVALEATPDSELSIFFRVFDKTFLFHFIEILFLSFLGLQFVTHLIFLKIEKKVAHLLDRQYVGMNTGMTKSGTHADPISKNAQWQSEYFTDTLRMEIKKLDQFKEDLLLEIAALQRKGKEGIKEDPPAQTFILPNKEKEIAKEQEKMPVGVSSTVAAEKKDSRMEVYFSRMLGTMGSSRLPSENKLSEEKDITAIRSLPEKENG